MKACVKIANVYDALLEETKKELVITKGNQVYIGKLFFKKEEWEKVRRSKTSVHVEGTAEEIIMKAYELLRDEDMLASDDKSLKVMLHWQFVNGFSDEMIDTHKYKNDTEYLASLN